MVRRSTTSLKKLDDLTMLRPTNLTQFLALHIASTQAYSFDEFFKICEVVLDRKLTLDERSNLAGGWVSGEDTNKKGYKFY